VIRLTPQMRKCSRETRYVSLVAAFPPCFPRSRTGRAGKAEDDPPEGTLLTLLICFERKLERGRKGFEPSTPTLATLKCPGPLVRKGIVYQAGARKTILR